MPITTTTHLNFRGDARAALEFYRTAFGGELNLVSYADANSAQDPSETDQIMYGELRGDNGIHVMGYDVPVRLSYEQGVNAYFVSIRGEDADEISKYWAGLANGATIIQNLEPAFWSPLYGMLEDRFGVVWVLDVVAQYDQS